MDYNAAVSAEIRAESAAQGITSTELARLSGIPYSTLARYLTTNLDKLRQIDVGVVAQIAEALGVTPASILTAASRRQQQAAALESSHAERLADTTGMVVEYPRREHGSSPTDGRRARSTTVHHRA